MIIRARNIILLGNYNLCLLDIYNVPLLIFLMAPFLGGQNFVDYFGGGGGGGVGAGLHFRLFLGSF